MVYNDIIFEYNLSIFEDNLESLNKPLKNGLYVRAQAA